ncbi:MAG: iron-containing alcohol dehydrogenase [Gracilibacteraceae bacterium]|jgi:alcohol dehydrogenase class IV|nr:iron-containing alcohol dehydrogenase [Gracilibacteraceae bacterium]
MANNDLGREIWKNNFSIDKVKMLRLRSTNLFLGLGAIDKIFDIAKNLKRDGIEKVLVVTGRESYVKCGAWEKVESALRTHNIGYALYNKIEPNPDADRAEEAAALGRKFGAQAVVGIGGGSPNDAAKGIAVLLATPEISIRDIYSYKVRAQKAVPIVAVNTTHGTGTEINRFSVISIPERRIKPGIVVDCIYPKYAIDDPVLMSTLPVKQTIYTSMDAFNHAFESVTSRSVTPLGFLLGQESIRLVARYLPLILNDANDLDARYYLVYAAMLAGVSFENSAIHITHAMEHPMSAFKPDLPHGLGLSVVLPSVLRAIYPAEPQLISSVLASIVPDLKGTGAETETAVAGLKKWLAGFGITETMSDIGFKKNDIEPLIDSLYETTGLTEAIGFCPAELNREKIAEMFRQSFC